MPNHFHGIITIGENQYNRGGGRDAMHGFSTTTNELGNKPGPQYKNIGSVIRGYKSAVTTYARKHKIKFNWQARFHDHIIRSMDEYIRISNYIKNNVVNWKRDKFFNDDSRWRWTL